MDNPNILVIDDDPFVLKSCKRILESEDYSTTLCSSVQEALKLVKEQKFHLLIIDMIMPEYNGIDLADKIKQDQKDVKILTMSGYMAPVPFSEIITRKDLNFLAKPFTPEEFLNAVEQVINSTSEDK